MTTEKTHFRKAFNSPYLSSSDITEPTILTIKKVILEKDKTLKTSDYFNTAYFAEKEIRKGEVLKPLILNATNSKIVKKFVESPFLEDWQDIPVEIYVDPKVKFMGDIVDGIRISKKKPVLIKPELKSNTKQWGNAVAAYKRDNNFESIEKRMIVSGESKKLIEKEAKNVS